jgi:Protein of unknown function (DUF551).
MKTIKEEAIEFAKKNPYPVSFTAFKAGAEFTQKWISVDDELPENSDDMLVKNGQHYEVAHWNGKHFMKHIKSEITNRMGTKSSYRSVPDVTHWKPINRK